MPETPDFDSIARRIAGVWGDSSTLKPLTEAIAKQLRLVWNARGAADIAKLEDDWWQLKSFVQFDGVLRKLDL